MFSKYDILFESQLNINASRRALDNLKKLKKIRPKMGIKRIRRLINDEKIKRLEKAKMIKNMRSTLSPETLRSISKQDIADAAKSRGLFALAQTWR